LPRIGRLAWSTVRWRTAIFWVPERTIRRSGASDRPPPGIGAEVPLARVRDGLLPPRWLSVGRHCHGGHAEVEKEVVPMSVLIGTTKAVVTSALPNCRHLLRPSNASQSPPPNLNLEGCRLLNSSTIPRSPPCRESGGRTPPTNPTQALQPQKYWSCLCPFIPQ